MIPKAMDSLDVVEMVILLEEIFGVDISDEDAEGFGSPAEIVDWLDRHPSRQRPNELAANLLKGLAKIQQNPDLAEGLVGAWRREQIAAIIREILK